MRFRRRNEDGAAAVEFALTFPLLILVLFGMISAGLTYSDHLAVTNAVREASRLGSAVDYDPNPTLWADAVQERTRQVYFNDGNTLTTAQVCVKLVTGAGAVLATPSAQCSDTADEPALPSSVPGNGCVVKVWVNKPAEINLVVAPSIPLGLDAASVSRYGRETGTCVP